MIDRDPGLFEDFDRRRDEASFRRLYGAHAPALFGLAVRLCGSRSEAEELVQEAWVRAVERHSRFDGRSAYGTWLAGILINCHREALRRRGRLSSAGDDASLDRPKVTPFPRSPGVRYHRVDVERALSRLADRYREVVVLHDLYGYTHREIGRLLVIDEGTSKSQLFRGRARLREILESSPPGPRTAENGGGS